MKSLSRVLLLATPWTAAYQAPLSMGFSRQEYWSGVPLPSPRRSFAAAAAAKSLQLCPTLCHPINGSLPGSHPWDSRGKNTGVGCHFLLQCMKVKIESEVPQSCPTFEIPWTVVYQASLSMGFYRQEYCNGLPFPSPEDLLTQGSNPGPLHCRQTLYPLSHLDAISKMTK